MKLIFGCAARILWKHFLRITHLMLRSMIFFPELKVLQVTLPDSWMSTLEILEFVIVVDCYPNVSVAYRILLTVPMTIASAGRSLSKLKLLKNYLRSTMSQEKVKWIDYVHHRERYLEHY